MKLFVKERCRRCKIMPGMRFCIRSAKDLCRNCCNDQRVDGKCPDTCAYRVKPSDPGTPFAAKVDSFTEYVDLLRKTLTYWGNHPTPLFDGAIPSALAESTEGRKRLHDFFCKITLPPGFPSEWISERWNLPAIPEPAPFPHPEHIAIAFIHKLEEGDRNGLAALYTDRGSEAVKFLLENLGDDKRLRKAETFDVISSGVNEARDSGFAHLDIDHRHPFTLVMRLQDGEWRILQRIWGAPDAIHAEKEIWKPVALNLSRKKLGDANDLIKHLSETYPDSPETFYYLGLYHFLSDHVKDAIDSFQKCVWLDPDFHEARYNLAAMQQVAGFPEAAETNYRKLLEINPQDARCLNNLATICIDEGRNDEARKLLDRCLAIQPDFEMARKNLERISGDSA
jgi:hypothetical protein